METALPPTIHAHLDVLCSQDLLQKLTPNDVARVYSGKPGCMCGCKGRYYVTADDGRSEVSPRMVVKVLRLLQADDRTCAEEGLEGLILYIPMGKLKERERNMVAYLCKSVTL